MMIEPVVIQYEGKPSHVIIPWNEWQRIQATLAEATDLAEAERVLADPATEWVPGEVADRLLMGEHAVRVWRDYRGLSQAALAQASGVSQPTIARIETGARKGTMQQMRGLAQALAITVDMLTATLD